MHGMGRSPAMEKGRGITALFNDAGECLDLSFMLRIRKERLRGREKELYELAVRGGVLESPHESYDAKLFKLFRTEERARQITEAGRNKTDTPAHQGEPRLLTGPKNTVPDPQPLRLRLPDEFSRAFIDEKPCKQATETAEDLFYRRLQDNINAMGSEIGKVSNSRKRQTLIETLETRAQIEFNVLVARWLNKQLPAGRDPLDLSRGILAYAEENGMPFVREAREYYLEAIRGTKKNLEPAVDAPARAPTPRRRRSGVRLIVETAFASIALAASPPEPTLQRAGKAAYEAVEDARYVIRLGEVASASWKWKAEPSMPSFASHETAGIQDITVFRSPFALASTYDGQPEREYSRNVRRSPRIAEAEGDGSEVMNQSTERRTNGDIHSKFSESLGLRRYRMLMGERGVTLNF
jgi:hypothetical protein